VTLHYSLRRKKIEDNILVLVEVPLARKQKIDLHRKKDKIILILL
jgi:hypothetical protein